MREYVIITDSSCDLSAPFAQELGLISLPLQLLLDEKSYYNYLDEREIRHKEFYDALREGKTATTSAVNVETFKDAFKEALDAGKDVLYLGFSSGLSATYQAGALAAEELRADYPEHKIYTVDTLAASLGQGMLLYLASQKKKEGADIDTLKAYVEEIRLQVAHWVMADDLHHLKRGGRVSAAAAFFGSALSIKPIIHMDEEGRLVVTDKVRGKRNALKKLYDTMKESALDIENTPIFISHADVPEDVNTLVELIRADYPGREIYSHYIGPVIGAHTGPGTVALFFLAKQR